ncbi:unnamed protein product [Gongylonema pulchrum]|uniref:Uncharacterized protein n=1 Tax=Gongylonema pulchrum TaxID=637853 RepID=A0A3P7PLQ3_9BILA|nr:unnamed protein product [Gongylonema pulchrum]
MNLNRGMKLVTGVDKGIRFIEGDSSTGGIVPALVLDSMFFLSALNIAAPIPLQEMANHRI